MSSTQRLHTVILLLILITGIAILGLLATRAVGGPLDPPNPPGSTMKTLQEVEPRTPISSVPFTITVPGSYYLTANVTAAPEGAGISVQANDVTIDLNGFVLQGNGVTQDGIVSTQFPAYTNLVVRNGTIAGWRNGIATEWVLTATYAHLTLRNNSGGGLRAGGGTLVDHVRAVSNGDHGILVNEAIVGADPTTQGSIIRNSTANGNGWDGIQYNENQNPSRDTGGVLIEDNVASHNGGGLGAPYGAGIRINGNRARVEGNNVVNNDGFGINVTGTNNYIVQNSGAFNLDSTGNLFAYDNFSVLLQNIPGGSFAPEETAPNVTNALSNVNY